MEISRRRKHVPNTQEPVWLDYVSIVIKPNNPSCLYVFFEHVSHGNVLGYIFTAKVTVKPKIANQFNCLTADLVTPEINFNITNATNLLIEASQEPLMQIVVITV
jgi:hypothetical protein